MTVMEMARMRASVKFLIGLRIEMCFTSDLFHTRRRMKVLMRIVSTKMRISERMSDLLSDLETSLIIY